MPLSAYNTTFGKHYDMREIATRVEEQIYQNEGVSSFFTYLHTNQNTTSPAWVFAVTDKAKNVPSFGHPLELKGTARDPKERFIVVDVRPFTRVLPSGEVVINAKDDFDLLMLRAGLQHFATENHPSELNSVGNFPMKVYVKWISEAISRKLGLSVTEQIRLTIITGVLYNSLFNDDGDRAKFSDLGEKEKIRIATSIAKATMIPAQDVFTVLDGLKAPVTDLDSYCDTLAAQTDIIRLERFNKGLLQNILGGSWQGLNSREVVAVALEHAPTFFAMVYAALTTRSYSKCHLATVTNDYVNKKGIGDEWVRGLLSLPDVAPIYKKRTF
jgi:hypothetical protein